MKDIPVKRGRRYISGLVAEGEHEHQDFKYAISDARKIARSVSAFANAGGGRLLIGIKDNGIIAGVRNEEDVYVVELAAHRYCEPPQEVDFAAYSIDTGMNVIVATIPQATTRPVRVREDDGHLRAYIRVADENIAAHPLMVRAWQYTGPLTFTLNADASALLDILDAAAEDGLDPAEAPLRLGMSARRTEDMIVTLAAAGIIRFIYNTQGFRIVRIRS